jgi:chondroitin AC lyase
LARYKLYLDNRLARWSPSTHMLRITTMLQAFIVSTSTGRNYQKIVVAAHCALKLWLTKDWQSQNWWFNQIQIPLQATSQLLMLGNNATKDQI